MVANFPIVIFLNFIFHNLQLTEFIQHGLCCYTFISIW